MIITRSPLRISLGGGGTDLPSYYREHGGFVISAAIDKYVYITLHETFSQELIVKYSQMEIGRIAWTRSSIPSCARLCGWWASGRSRIWKSSACRTFRPARGWDRPAVSRRPCCARCTPGRRIPIPRQELAEQACHIEIDLLRRAHRQAGSVHRLVRRHHLLPFPARRPRGGGAAAALERDAGQPGRQSAAVLYRLHALGFRDPGRTGHAHAPAGRRHDFAICTW